MLAVRTEKEGTQEGGFRDVVAEIVAALVSSVCGEQAHVESMPDGLGVLAELSTRVEGTACV